MSNYPNSLDGNDTLPEKQDSIDDVFAADHNMQSDAIKALEAKLGVGASQAVSNSILCGTDTGESGWTTTPYIADYTNAQHDHTSASEGGTITIPDPVDPTPSGSIVMFGGSSAPTGWLLCDGSVVSRATYSALFTAIGVAFGAGDGSTTFGLPNIQDKLPMGASGTKALASTGGATSVTLIEANLPSHYHTVNPPATNTGTVSADHTHNTHTDWSFRIGTGGYNYCTGSNTDPRGNATSGISANHVHAVDIAQFNSGSTGSGTSFSIIPSYIALNYIIKT